MIVAANNFVFKMVMLAVSVILVVLLLLVVVALQGIPLGLTVIVLNIGRGQIRDWVAELVIGFYFKDVGVLVVKPIVRVHQHLKLVVNSQVLGVSKDKLVAVKQFLILLTLVRIQVKFVA
jgi:hypothetical protein